MSVQVKGSGTIGGLDEGLVVSGIVTSSTQINVGSNIKLGTAGVVTATSFAATGAITATGTIETTGSELKITGAEPRLTFTDTDNNPDFQIWANAQKFAIYDSTNSATRLHINSGGKIGINQTAPYADVDITSSVEDTDDSALSAHGIRLAHVGATDEEVIPITAGFVTQQARARAAIGFISKTISGAAGMGGAIGFYTRNTADGHALYRADERLRITEAGKVGIGTDNPTDILDINSDSASAVTNMYLRNHANLGGAALNIWTQGTYSSPTYKAIIGCSDAGGNIRMGSASNHELLLLTNNTPRVNIKTTGDIGINYTGTPNATLDIRTDRDPSNGLMCFIRNNAQNGNGAFYGMDVNSVGTWSVGMPDNTNVLSVRSGGQGNSGTEYLSIASNYLVTVGNNNISSTTQPSKLRVQGSYVNAVGPFGILEFKNRDNSGNAVCSIRGVRHGVAAGNYSAGLTFHTNNSNPASASDGDHERLRIRSDGKVVIGSNYTGGTLSVTGNLITDDGTNGRITIQADGTSTNQILSTTTGFGSYCNMKYQAADHIFLYGGTERFRVKNDGRVVLNNAAVGSNEYLTLGPNGSTACDMAFRLNNDNDARIKFYDGGSTLRGLFGYLSLIHI